MDNIQIAAERIKIQAKSNNISVKQLLINCNMGVNTVVKMSNGKDILSQNLCKIADYFKCSVDYLLGRTDNPNVNQTIVPSKDNNSTDNDELISLINNLSLVERSKIVVMINEMQNSKS